MYFECHKEILCKISDLMRNILDGDKECTEIPLDLSNSALIYLEKRIYTYQDLNLYSGCHESINVKTKPRDMFMLIVKYGFSLEYDFLYDCLDVDDYRECAKWFREFQQAGCHRFADDIISKFSRSKEWAMCLGANLEPEKMEKNFSEYDDNFLKEVLKKCMTEAPPQHCIPRENLIMFLIFASSLGFIGIDILKNFIAEEFEQYRECVQKSQKIDETSKNFLIENIRQMEEALIFGNESIGCADEEKIYQLIFSLRNSHDHETITVMSRGLYFEHTFFMQIPLKLRLIIHYALRTFLSEYLLIFFEV